MHSPTAMAPRVKKHKKKKRTPLGSYPSMSLLPFEFYANDFLTSTPAPSRAPSECAFDFRVEDDIEEDEVVEKEDTPPWVPEYYAKSLAERVEYVSNLMDDILEQQAILLANQAENIQNDEKKLRKVWDDMHIIIGIFNLNHPAPMFPEINAFWQADRRYPNAMKYVEGEEEDEEEEEFTGVDDEDRKTLAL